VRLLLKKFQLDVLLMEETACAMVQFSTVNLPWKEVVQMLGLISGEVHKTNGLLKMLTILVMSLVNQKLLRVSIHSQVLINNASVMSTGTKLMEEVSHPLKNTGEDGDGKWKLKKDKDWL